MMKLYTKCSRCGALMEQYHDGTFPAFSCCMFNGDEYSPSYAAIDDLFEGWSAAGESHVICPACIKSLLLWFNRSESVINENERNRWQWIGTPIIKEQNRND